jgi:hypothetical protein
MTSNGSAGNRDGFESWVASLQRPPGAEQKSEPDITSALVNDSATHVQQIPKELIHRLRERETQGLLGVEVERTAIFKPPPELLARAKRMQPPSKPTSPSELPPAEVPTAPPPEAAVPTVRPPPPVTESFEDGWAELDSGLEALKPIAARSVPAASRPLAPMFPSSAPRVGLSAAPRTTASAAPRAATDATAARTSAPPSSRSSGAPPSKPNAAVAVARTVDIGKPADAWPSLSDPASDLDMLDEPTRLRAGGFAALLGNAAPAVAAAPPAPHAPAASPLRSARTPPMPFTVSAPQPSEEPPSELTEPRVSGVVAHPDAPVDDSLSGEMGERGASGRNWVVIAAVFLSLVVIALAALAR